MGGRSTYTTEKAEEIIQWISEGKPLRQFCRDRGIPWRTVYSWLEAEEDFAARFARARDVGADAIAEQALEIADTPLEGVRLETREGKKPKEVREDMLGHRKLQVETRLKLLAKWFPQKYGEKTEHTINGPVALSISQTDSKL
jgi:hypothetical protein